MIFLQVQAQNFLSSISTDFIIAIVSSISTLVASYMLIRERLLKTELKLESIYDYIDNRNTITENKIKDLQADIKEFKDLNKETTKSLSDNTAAIQELKVVLHLVTEKLTK